MKKLFLFAVIITILFSSITPINAEPPNINSKAYILIDLKSGQVLAEKNSSMKWYPASTTKMMTAILAFENGNLDQEMTASFAAVNEIGVGGMNIGIMAGEKLKMRDLLNALLIESANETANILAENICPTRKEFIELMNKKAKELGALDTHFVNTCGIFDSNHYTTASDLAKIARYAMTIPEFRNIVSKKEYDMPVTNKHTTPGWGHLATTNKLLSFNQTLFSRVIGVKTGYVSESGNNLVSAGEDNKGTQLLAVVLGVFERNSVFNYSEDLLNYGFKNYSMQEITPSNQLVKNVKVIDAKDSIGLNIVTSSQVKAVLPLDKNNWNIETTVNINPEIKAPVLQNTKFGYIEYRRNGLLLGKTDLVAANSVEKSFNAKFHDASSKVLDSWLFRFVVLTCIIVIIVFIITRKVLRILSRTYSARRHEE